MKNNKNINYFIIGTFILFLSLPTIFGLLLPKRTNSMIENRRLNDLPEPPKSWQELKQTPKRYDEYYADHFGFRWSLLFLYRHLKFFIHDSPLETAMFGNKPEWIFYNSKKDGDNVGDYRNINQFSQKQLNNFIFKIKKRQRWLAERGIKYLFVIAPSKHYIYPENLPNYIKQTKNQNLVSQLTQELSRYPEINFIDLTSVLIHAKQDKLLYYKGDPHWNHHGANIAQYAIAKKLMLMFPGKIQPYFHLDDVFQRKSYQGGLAQVMGLGEYFKEQISVPQLNPCVTDYSPKNKRYNQTFTTQCSDQGLTTVVFRDSFFTNLQPYVSLYFSKSQYIWKTMNIDRMEKLIGNNYPDLVIEEKVDRYLH